ncbi:MAG TPA: hypothetical protein VK437_14950 [Steroidobacteraceae bacterium]|nr:hypothetical protein [Steroidobacteraceae bacterium]
MDDAAIAARIAAIECEIFAPARYTVKVLAASATGGGVDNAPALAEELNRLRAEQIRRANQRFGKLAPIGGSRLSTGHLERPEPPEPGSWMTASDSAGGHDPIRRFIEQDLGRKWEDE